MFVVQRLCCVYTLNCDLLVVGCKGFFLKEKVPVGLEDSFIFFDEKY